MKQPKHLLTLLLILIFTVRLEAQGVKQMNLSQAVEYAMSHSAEVKNARLEIQSSKDEVKSVVSTGLPQVTATANFTHNVQIAAMQLPDFISPAVYGVLINEGLLTPDKFQAGSPQTVQFGAPSSLTGMISLNQLVFDGTYFLGLKAAKQYVKLSEDMRVNTEANVIETVKKSFYGALITKENIGLVDESLRQINKSYNETVEMQKAGFAEQLDVDRLKLAKSNLETRARNLKLQYEIMVQLLKVTIGMPVTEQLEPTGDMNSYLLTPVTAPLDLTKRPEYHILNQQLVLDSLNIRRYKVGYLPTLRLNASYQQNSFADEAEFKGLGNAWNPGTSYGLNLSIPIFDGFYKQAKISQARVQLEQHQNTFDQTMNNLMFQAEQAKLNLKMQEENLVNQKSTRDLARKIYETTLTKFNEGVTSSFELIQAEGDKTSAEIEYHNALYQRLLAQIELDKSLGNLNSK